MSTSDSTSGSSTLPPLVLLFSFFRKILTFLPRKKTLPATGSSALPLPNSNSSSSKSTGSVSSPCRTRLQLKGDLSTIQKGNSSISEYVSIIKEIADALEPVSDLELVSATRRGLGDDWINIYNAIRCRSTLPTFSELHALLLQSSSEYNNGIGGAISGFSRCDTEMLRLGFECDYLIAISKPRLKRSTVIESELRTSFSTTLRKAESKNPIVQAIEKRISEFSQVPLENGEPIHVMRYEKIQYFRLHSDYFLDTTNIEQSGGQRIATMLMYLSEIVEGGETYFPMAGTGKCSCAGKMLKGSSVKPIKGDAVLFWSLGLDGEVDPKSVHTGCEVLSGEKWCATKFMRQNKYY
ncbi:hypothetical protein C5167_047404 [Papaver somniferum]|uniref:Fe2OG dioxygenase domain-containing protein n=1 Tax=Papaver somniferum TaxID=3469 RepID=A0A4Y7LKC1_PAPSO|nr:hypothetical protein C5167_047404 [Papaver somniferum]